MIANSFLDKEFDRKNIYRSDEEYFFSAYCEELMRDGYISHYEYEPFNFELCGNVRIPYKQQLKTKVKYKDFGLFRPKSYTPDFLMMWTDKAKGVFVPSNEFDPIYMPFIDYDSGKSIIEVKPSYDFRGKNSSVVWEIKWLFSTKDKYVQLIKIGDVKKDLFAKTFLPERARYSVKAKKLRLKGGKPLVGKTLEEFVESQKSKETKFW